MDLGGDVKMKFMALPGGSCQKRRTSWKLRLRRSRGAIWKGNWIDAMRGNCSVFARRLAGDDGGHQNGSGVLSPAQTMLWDAKGKKCTRRDEPK